MRYVSLAFRTVSRLNEYRGISCMSVAQCSDTMVGLEWMLKRSLLGFSCVSRVCDSGYIVSCR